MLSMQTKTASAQAANYPFCTIEPNVGEVAVPDADGGPTQGITFKVSQNQSNADLNDVTATISSSEEIEGKLFSRLKVAE